MSKKKKRPAWLPNKEDWAGRWGTACVHYLAETKHQCDECQIRFITTDLLYAFGNPRGDQTKPHFFLCAPCGYMALQSGSFPVATLMYLDDATRSQSWPNLGPDLQARVIATFRQIDQIHASVAEIAARYGVGGPDALEEQEPS